MSENVIKLGCSEGLNYRLYYGEVQYQQDNVWYKTENSIERDEDFYHWVAERILAHYDSKKSANTECPCCSQITPDRITISAVEPDSKENPMPETTQSEPVKRKPLEISTVIKDDQITVYVEHVSEEVRKRLKEDFMATNGWALTSAVGPQLAPGGPLLDIGGKPIDTKSYSTYAENPQQTQSELHAAVDEFNATFEPTQDIVYLGGPNAKGWFAVIKEGIDVVVWKLGEIKDTPNWGEHLARRIYGRNKFVFLSTTEDVDNTRSKLIANIKSAISEPDQPSPKTETLALRRT